MKTINYTDEELELVNFMENTAPESVSNLNTEMKQLKISVKAKVSKRKPIN